MLTLTPPLSPFLHGFGFKYFNDNQRFIERLLEGVATIRIENNLDFDDVHALEEVVRTAVSELQD